jgi:dienelactone hydrolase
MLARSLLLFVLFVSFLPAEDKPPTYPPPEEVRAAFHKLLDRPRVPLDVMVSETGKKLDGGLVEEVLTFASEKKADGSTERVPVLIVRPATVSGKAPAAIVLHGTGGTKEGMRGWLVELAKRGIIGVAIDARSHGARSGGAKGSAAYVEAITKAWKTKSGEPMEHPFYYDTVYDLWRLVDYLETRPDVDAKRIAMGGTSMGGIETWLAATVDDRVAVLFPAIGVQSFRWSLENGKWQGRANTIKGAHEAARKDLGKDKVDAEVCRALWSKVIPGILDQFDCPSLLRLAAGRPMIILNGEKDGNCPIEGARLAFAEAEKAYKAAGASDKLKILVANVGHTVTDEHKAAALDWCEKWLKAK